MYELKGKTFAIFVDKFFNEREFWYPYFRMQEAGAKVVILGPEAGMSFIGQTGGTQTVVVEKSYSEVTVDDFDGVIVPGGYAPDHMRRHKDCLKLVSDTFKQGKLVAYICHAGWVPISAGILKGKRCTSFFALKDDMVNAGALWEDSKLVVDGNLISSPTPNELPDFCRGIVQWYLDKK